MTDLDTRRICTHRHHHWPHRRCGRVYDTVFMYCDKHMMCNHPQFDQVQTMWGW